MVIRKGRTPPLGFAAMKEAEISRRVTVQCKGGKGPCRCENIRLIVSKGDEVIRSRTDALPAGMWMVY